MEGNNGELRVVDTSSKGSGILAIVRDDRGEFRIYSSIDWFSFWTSRSTTNFGSRTMSSSALSDLVLNMERSNNSPKGRSSKNKHSSGCEFALIEGVGLTKLSCLLDLLEIRMGLSTTWAGFGFGFTLV